MKKKKADNRFHVDFFNSLYLLNKNEKKKVLKIVEKKNIGYFLFYTDYRNIPNIIRHGICQIKNIQIDDAETYYVWSYLQHDETIDLELDTSSRAYFWKWATDTNMKLETFCIFGIDPIKLAKLTVNDWVFDSSLSLVSVRETIPVETIDWVMIRREQPLKKVEELLKMANLNIKVYYGNNSEIKRLKPKPPLKTPPSEKTNKEETRKNDG